MGQEVLKRFDRYYLLDSIAQGGMAEIYRARPASLDGGGRLVIIKRILAGYGKNKDFRQMFKSEIKVMMGFNHPNVIQLHDFGEVENQPFIAMEYMDGKNLRQFISRFGKKNETLPVELAVYIIEQVAAGLHYAHTFKDKISGESLRIVHRDISPQNILISYEGSVKIIDFGIAKASTNQDSTRVGIIKGKPSYLSPEQITAQPLDARSDIFSLGTVLWEALTGKKLFAVTNGENEFAVLKLIESSDSYVKPPSTQNPEIPRELDDIVMRALAKSREKRFQSCEELQRALSRFLRTAYPDFSPSDLSHSAKNLFSEDIVEDRKQLQRLSARVDQLLQEARPADEISKTFGSEKPADLPPPRHDFDPPSTVPPDMKTSISGRLGRLGSINKIEIESSSVRPDTFQGKAPTKRPEPKSRSKSDRRGGTPYRYTPKQDMRLEPGRSRGGTFRFVAVVLAAVAGYVYVTQPTGPVPDRGPGSERTPRPTETRATTGKTVLRLVVNPGLWGKATLNERVLDNSHPIMEVPLDRPLELVIQQDRFKPFKREFVINSREAGNQAEWVMNITLDPVEFGYLSITTTPSAEAIIRAVDRGVASESKPWILTTPFENEKLPAGTYRIHLENKVLGMEKNIVVDIKDGKTIRMVEKLNLTP